ncbi:hypothetical protein AA0117_g12152 [Alternaria alternata]|uniref:Uncharacterized protein n=2 Tax=Alternaria alternata complex TaxID=187734 RepID=A0A4V1WQ04_ALTAL|nr:hypothetical protein AA0115_g11545 [Alternaria tenuissima]RYN65476.1 hypothetical protein AA0117_g12152 [Alternaria alternata]
MAHARLLKRSRRRPLDGEDNVLPSGDDTSDDENPGPEP